MWGSAIWPQASPTCTAPTTGRTIRLDSVAWSLEIEVQFYVLVPALALLLCAGRTTIRRSRIVLIAGLATACHALGIVTAFAFIGSSIQFFLLGWLLADIYVADWAEEPRSGRRGDVSQGAWLWRRLVIGLAFAPTPVEGTLRSLARLRHGIRRGPQPYALRRMLSNRWIATIGGMCYSIYLVHYALFLFVSRSLRPLDAIPTPVALVAACVVLIPLGARRERRVLRARGATVLWILRGRERVRARFARMSRTSQPDQVIVLPEAVDELSEVATQ